MPPSPASSRRSLSQEMRVENHKRGRSLEGGLRVQEKDDDLALFNEMQAHERENFLLQSSDDFEDSFSSKLRHFADYKIGVSIPARGESSDLLSADGEKNDYEWLMTPPDTPLFPSLDDEPAPAHIPTRGRTRTQPIAISRSSTMEKSHRTSRGSASPSRSSPSPRSGNSMGQSRIKPSSAPHTSPISSIRSSPTPSRRASPPPSKPSTPVPRSSSPTPRRMSTGSGASAGAAGVRGVSPQKVTRGNSASPKIKAWQANIPGFSCDVPPNLRTSLADRPASYVRGSSPASRNGRDSSSKGNRQSMSPAATRSISSSHSHERDWFSSHSKGSIVSSGDDDVDSLQSVTVGSMDQSTPRKVDEYLSNNRSLAHSRRSPKISASAPKRSFDSVLRQMDNRKTPQNMFRPLLSSVPSTTFYVGKASSTHSMTSHNSSFTTSSNTSFDHGSALPEPEGYYNQDDMVGESRKMICPDIQEEVFSFDKADEDEPEGEIYGDIDRGHSAEGVPDYIDVGTTPELAQVRDDLSDAVNIGCTMLCSLCGCSYDATDIMEIEIKLCEECRMKENFHDGVFPETSAVGPNRPLAMPNSSPEEDLDSLAIGVSKSQVVVVDEPKESWTHSLDHSSSVSYAEVQEDDVDNGEGEEEPKGGGDPPGRSTTSQESEQFTDHPSAQVSAAEGMGISLLLKRSSSSKGLIIQGRALTASNILPYDDLSYTRETSTSIRSSIGHGSFSSSSSIDLSSSRQTETRMQRQFSGKRSENENYRYEVRSQSVGSSLSGMSSYSHQAIGLATTTSEVNFEGFTGEVNKNLSSETAVASAEELPGLEVVGAEPANSSSTRSAVPEEDDCDCGESGRKLDANFLHSSPRTDDAVQPDTKESFEDDTLASSDDFQETTKSENHESLQENAVNEIDRKVSGATLDDSSGPMNEMSAPAANGTLLSTSEIVAGSEVIDIPHDIISAMDGLQELPKKDTDASTSEPVSSDTIVDILGQSTVTVESHGRNRTRSLTLEEATDTILFCSSIVHDLAYKAATIAMEKEREKESEKEDLDALEGFKPAITIVGKSTPSDRKDHLSGRIISKRGIKPHPKPRQKPTDNHRKPISNKPENDENVDESLTRNVGLPPKFDSMKPPKLESKCNCTIM